ncbi:GCN5 family acetyltransferase [Acinetobacter sp. NCu2D-2]|uniref:GNAT family N-acetyltransferase n=1 Tax=Acinetobacter sp. NCu2D-2 TaxID=1608473 RepID=UPI0007CDB025|nr:N-acetyltransferase [Acinetobacter sp. NCu2D-2]ANF81098.1 GCN5 family acetyltransferase [Acinetobacter sp. NCu2D-2]
MQIQIRAEQVTDIEPITDLTQAAFADVEYSSHTEHLIVNALRVREKLTLSLVAVIDDQLVGHVAISPVRLSSGNAGWYGLGPISVQPELQGKGIGRALMHEVLQQLKALGAAGCVLLGDPNYYQKFGFKAYAQLSLADVPPEYFQAIIFTGTVPQAEVFYDEAFYVEAE